MSEAILKIASVQKIGGEVMKKYLMSLLIITILIIPVVSNAAFNDVPSDHWAYSYINELSSKGIINGYPDGNYGPSDTLTYGQFIKLIVTASMKDVDYNLVKADFDHWAAKYVKVATNYKAIEVEKINKQNIDNPISRIDVVRIMGICDINMRNNPQKTVEKLDFKDISNITSKEKSLLKHAVANSIIGGYPDGTFKPDNNLTRAEAAKILSVYMSK